MSAIIWAIHSWIEEGRRVPWSYSQDQNNDGGEVSAVLPSLFIFEGKRTMKELVEKNGQDTEWKIYERKKITVLCTVKKLLQNLSTCSRDNGKYLGDIDIFHRQSHSKSNDGLEHTSASTNGRVSAAFFKW